MRRILLALALTSLVASGCSGHSSAAKAAASPSEAAAATPDRPTRTLRLVPESFRPVSATFGSDRTGWVLGTVDCGVTAGCDVVAVTHDGGRTWEELSRPPMSGGGELRFASARDGFLLQGRLLATHDGGRSWRHVDTLRDAISQPWYAEAAQGELWLTGRLDHDARALWHGSARRASFDLAPVDLPDGSADDLQLSLHGRGVVLSFLDGGSPRLLVSEDGDTFAGRDLPCVPSGPLALRTTRDYLLVCGRRVLRTADAGRSWRDLTELPEDGAFPLVTARSLFVATGHGLQASTDDGGSWSETLDADVTWAGFEGPGLGFVLDDEGLMRVSRDDGRTWEEIDFRRTR